MMTNLRGDKQTETVVFRCSQADKANLQKEAFNRGMSMSVLIKEMLIDARIIDAHNTPDKW